MTKDELEKELETLEGDIHVWEGKLNPLYRRKDELLKELLECLK